MGANSVALGINDAGQVVGGSFTAAGNYHAFITGPNGVGMTDIGTLRGTFSIASGISDIGQVVGYTYPAGADFHAFITGLNGINMTDLNSLVSFGGILTNATAINSHGQVAVMGNVSKPETCAMLLAG